MIYHSHWNYNCSTLHQSHVKTTYPRYTDDPHLSKSFAYNILFLLHLAISEEDWKSWLAEKQTSSALCVLSTCIVPKQPKYRKEGKASHNIPQFKIWDFEYLFILLIHIFCCCLPGQAMCDSLYLDLKNVLWESLHDFYHHCLRT